MYKVNFTITIEEKNNADYYNVSFINVGYMTHILTAVLERAHMERHRSGTLCRQEIHEICVGDSSV